MNTSYKEVPLPNIHTWGCKAVAVPSWPGGAGGEEEQGCCKEAGALEKDQKPTQHFNLCFYNLPVFFVPILFCLDISKLLVRRRDVIEECTPKIYLLLEIK